MVQADEKLNMLKRFVEIESFSHDKTGIKKMAEELINVFAIFKPVSELINEETGSCHLKMTFGSGKRQILLLTHLDTVYPKDTLVKMPWRVENGKAYGPGVLDIKASYVIVYEVLKKLEKEFFENYKIVWLNTGDEEIGSPSGKHYVISEAKKSEAVFVLEPAMANGALKTARKGGGKYRISVKGKSAHAGVNPEDGINAIVRLANLVLKIAEQEDLKNGTTVTVGTISGGTLFNVVPDYATCEVDVRVKTEDERKRIETFFQNLKYYTSEIEVEGEIYRPPFVRSEGTANLFRLAKECARKQNIDLLEAETGGGSDGNFAATTGVPVLDGLGARGGGAHSPDEFVYIDSIEERAKLLACLLVKLKQR